MNTFISARAGSGKTTALVARANAIISGDKEARILMLAFNTAVASELQSRMPPSVTCCTLNSLGNRIVRNNLGYREVDEEKLDKLLYFEVCKKDNKKKWLHRHAVKLCTLAKCAGLRVDEMTMKNLISLEEHYELDSGDADNYYEIVRELYRVSVNDERRIDFNDQLLLPILHKDWCLPIYSHILVDEAQDLNNCQIQLLIHLVENSKRSGFPDCQLIAVGDPYQAIYGFRGSSVDAINNLITTFSMQEEKLTTCWRCSSTVIGEAQKVVEDIFPRPDAPTGEVRTLDKLPPLTNGSFILCRTRAPLIGLAHDLLTSNQPFQLWASEGGKKLAEMHNRFDLSSVDKYLESLEEHRMKEATRLTKARKRNQLNNLHDALDILAELAVKAPTPSQIPNAIEKVFERSNCKIGPILSTIHRVKGMEADNVYLLRPDLLPHPRSKSEWQKQQEHNLKYVAITRARTNFYYIKDKQGRHVNPLETESDGMADLFEDGEVVKGF